MGNLAALGQAKQRAGRRGRPGVWLDGQDVPGHEIKAETRLQRAVAGAGRGGGVGGVHHEDKNQNRESAQKWEQPRCGVRGDVPGSGQSHSVSVQAEDSVPSSKEP